MNEEMELCNKTHDNNGNFIDTFLSGGMTSLTKEERAIERANFMKKSKFTKLRYEKGYTETETKYIQIEEYNKLKAELENKNKLLQYEIERNEIYEKENEQLKAELIDLKWEKEKDKVTIDELQDELDKANKIIDKMAEFIVENTDYAVTECSCCDNTRNDFCHACKIDYFTKQVESEE